MRKLFYILSIILITGALPMNAEWYACGVFQGWNPSQAQAFTQVSPGIYSLDIDFSAGKDFKISNSRPNSSLSSSEQWSRFDQGAICLASSAVLYKGLDYISGTDNITAPAQKTLTVVINETLSKMAFTDGSADIVWDEQTIELNAYLRVDDWERPCVWVWNDPDQALYSTFPGKTMELVEPGLYRWTERASVMPDKILFSDNGSTIKRSREPVFVNNMVWDAQGNILGPISDNPVSSSPLGTIKSWTSTEYGISAQCEHGSLEICFYGDGVVKVFTLPSGVTENERRSITVIGRPGGLVSISETDNVIRLASSQVVATVDKSTSLITFTDAVSGDVYIAERKGVVNTVGNVTASFSCPGTTSFTGGGYYDRVNLSGSSLKMDNNQTGWWPDYNHDDNHNICIPFLVSERGFGVLFDDHYRGAMMIPAKDALSYTSSSCNPVAYYFVGGGCASKVMENYTSLTGRQELPPFWALGYISSRFGYATEAEGRDVVSRIKACDIPLDGIVFDIYWQGNRTTYGMGNLEWYKPNFPTPEQMIADFRAQGVNTILITEPYFAKGSSNYSTLISQGFSADDDVSGMEWIGGGALLDATNPDALDWMWQYYRKHTASGVTGWWLDLGEPEKHDSDSHHLGGSVSQVHNEYGNLWVERVYRGLKEEFPDMRPMLLPRSGTSGMQRFAIFPWTGDITRSWRGLAVQVPAMLCAGMSGVGYLGSDIGGFNTTGDNPDLYLRWIEFGAFSPVLRTHVSNAGGNSEPYHYPSILSDIRKFINLRYSYLPYTYTLAYENSAFGAPLARPMSYYTADASLDDSYQYYWGADLLIAPVVDNTTSRSITFPEPSSLWLDLNNLTDTYYGGEKVSYSAPLNVLPHFARVGSIIPRYNSESFSSTSAIDRSKISLDCYTYGYLGDHAHGYIFDDDVNSTTSLSDEAYALLKFDIDCTERFELNITREGSGYATEPASRDLTFNLPLVNIAYPLKLSNGYTLADVNNDADLAASDAAVMRNDDGGLKIHLKWDGNDTKIYAYNGSTGLESLSSPANISVTGEAGSIICRYVLPDPAAEVTVDVYDIYGQLVSSVPGSAVNGVNSVSIDVAGGIYVVCLSSYNNRLFTTKVFVP